MPPRRTHTKSRNGCAKCKKRRVKCDEVHPACGNCIKHAIECDFSTARSPNGPTPRATAILSPPASTPETSSTVGSPPPTPSTIHSDAPPVPVTESYFPFTSPHQYVPVLGFTPNNHLILPPVESSRWTMGDMELLHHYTNTIPSFLAFNDNKRESVWKDSVPKLAFGDKSGCAMHAILAVSSLHLAFLEPENRSMRLINGTAHYDQAVRIMSYMVRSIRKDSCEPLFISSSLIVVFAITSPLISGNPGPENETWELPEWIPLIRGVHSILKEVWAWVETGCLSPLLSIQLYEGPERFSEETARALDALYRLCTDTSEPDSDEIKDTETSSTYFGAIHKLRRSFTNCSELQDNTVSLIFLWPICVSDKYVALLKQRRPRALIIFAHYCVVLKWVEACWWVRGRAEHELVRIERSIHDLGKWKKWLEWPIKIVRGEGTGGNTLAAAA